ncbi:hypothetical protein [Zunongwangia sp. HGR-M22]|uniref:hypothetical protein n=1 Tax=Zunongwangia sp. HGR-M22 TaxID=3015168 RepID=UPI0022DE5996|nr:hypothetical protein [Zunongwangia sp. HGR-M22]WBL26776.1 hypothetical protein PBT91_05810 [Zunongwangia sp. HGR-M22]
MTIENLLIIYDTDFKKRNWLDWIISHSMFSPPIHRYSGRAEILSDHFIFRGFDKQKDENVEIVLYRHLITQLYLGYDKIYSRFQVRSSFFWQPIRIQYQNGSQEKPEYIYLISNYNHFSTSNKELFEALKIWLS